MRTKDPTKDGHISKLHSVYFGAIGSSVVQDVVRIPSTLQGFFSHNNAIMTPVHVHLLLWWIVPSPLWRFRVLIPGTFALLDYSTNLYTETLAGKPVEEGHTRKLNFVCKAPISCNWKWKIYVSIPNSLIYCDIKKYFPTIAHVRLTFVVNIFLWLQYNFYWEGHTWKLHCMCKSPYFHAFAFFRCHISDLKYFHLGWYVC